MDDLVEKALAKWPNVPAIAGWLKLTSQGQWLLTGPVPEGLSISNPRILNFIARNYACETDGRYYFQNGPQKAYVDLEYTPWVMSIVPHADACWVLATHTGLVCKPKALFTDEQGRVLIDTEWGLGLLHSSDVGLFAEGLEAQPSGDFTHTARWWVPQQPAQAFPNQRMALRLGKNTLPGYFEQRLQVQLVQSALVPAQFQFITQPEV